MSQFDELDARTAAATERVFADPVIWRPMVSAPGFIVHARPDPQRPVRGMGWFTDADPDDHLSAIPTWQITGLPVSAQPGGGQVNTATLLIDFERVLFKRWPQYGEPKKGDWIELPSEKDPANRMVEIDSLGDDGSARLWCWCNIVTPQPVTAH